MPVEIRELVIKTTLESRSAARPEVERTAELQALRRDVLDECERMLRTYQGRRRIDR